MKGKTIDPKSYAAFKILVPFEGGESTIIETGEKVVVKPFEIAIRPVTNKEYEEFDPSHQKQRDKYSNKDEQPVVNVSWEEAVNFCEWLSEKTDQKYCLPTEAEWEFAASGGGKREYPWGNDDPTPERANYSESKIGKTTPVGSYSLGMTPEGLFDMAGNVWEWCEDWYDKEEKYRVLRGGAFDGDPEFLRCAVRNWYDPRYRDVDVGFRIVRNL